MKSSYPRKPSKKTSRAKFLGWLDCIARLHQTYRKTITISTARVNLTVELIRPLLAKRSSTILACVRGAEDVETPDLVAALAPEAD